MPEMWQRSNDSHREVRPENGAAVLGLLEVPEVPDDAEHLREKLRAPKGPRKHKSTLLIDANTVID